METWLLKIAGSYTTNQFPMSVACVLLTLETVAFNLGYVFSVTCAPPPSSDLRPVGCVFPDLW